MKQRPAYIVGVDEAGRGPLAGPVAVGVAVVPRGFNWKPIPGVGDSKQVSPQNRFAILGRARVLKREGKLNYAVALVSASAVDRAGITGAVQTGIVRCFKKLGLNPRNTEVRLDGLLRAPEVFKNQKTITGGDAREKIIGLASILAKVTRDRYMERLSARYPKYGFDIHKGYGTPAHRKVIQRWGLSPVHRKTFCTKLLASEGRRV